MTNPIDQDLAMQSPSSTSPLPWLSQTNRTSKKLLNSPFPTGKHPNLKFQLTLLSFSLKESARKLSWVFLLSPGVHTHTKRKISLHLISYLTLSKNLQQSRTLSLFHSYGSNTKRRKSSQLFSPFHTFKSSSKKEVFSTLSSSLPLILFGLATRKGKSFHVSLHIYIYIYICCFKKPWNCVGDFLKVD